MNRVISLIPIGLLLALGCDHVATAPDQPVPSLGVQGVEKGKIAWAKQVPGSETGFDIVIMNADGSGLRQLTNDPGTDDEPAISPDGRYIVFHSMRTGDGDIYLMRSDGLPGTAQRVTSGPRPERHPTWSPDGTMIAYEAPSVVNTSTQIFVQRVPVGSPVQVTFSNRSSTDPAWSPDGDRLAYVRYTPSPVGTNRPTIYIQKFSTGTTIKLTDPTYYAFDPAWSPDGRWLAYSTNEFRNDTLDIAVIADHGWGTAIRTTTSVRSSGRPVWSPSGAFIAIEASQPPAGSPSFFDIRRITVGGSNVLLPHNDMTLDDMHPDWR